MEHTHTAWQGRLRQTRETHSTYWQRTQQIYNIDIAALSQTKLAEGALCERGAGYTFFWSERQPEEQREAGVSFAIKSALVGKLVGPRTGINDRLISVRIPLSHGKKFVTIVSACAPTLTNPDEVKDKFYEDLNALITSVFTSDKLIILDDFSARVGCDSDRLHNRKAWGG